MGDIAQLEKEKRRAEKKDNLREVSNLCNLLGQEYLKDGDYDEALSQHKEEASLCEALADTIGVSVANRRIGEVFCEMGKWDKALHYQNRHLSLAVKAKSLVEEQRAYATLGRTHLQRAEVFGANGQENEQDKALTDAEHTFLKSLSCCERLKGTIDTEEHSQMRCRLYLNLGLVLESRRNDKKARDFIGQALTLCSSHDFHEDAFRCHSALGGIYFRLGELSEALKEGQRMLKLAEKLRDKMLQFDSHNFLAQIHLANSDYESAKKCFYKSYKLKHPSLEERNRRAASLKVVVSLCNAEDSLVLLKSDQEEQKLKCYENLGDGLAKLGIFSKALEYYHLMLDLALKIGKEASFLAPIYLSLAQTYLDNKQYQEAVQYYRKEYDIKLVEDPNDASKTMLSLAVACENKGDKYETLECLYIEARTAAIKAGNLKQEHKVLYAQSQLTGIPEEVKHQLQTEMKDLANKSGFDPEAESSEEESESEEEIDLDLINFSDSEDEGENFDRPRPSRQRRTNIAKRNEKGETALHKACMAGNLNMVKKLIMQSHPINPRDNCGWLPLHEAANHGFVNIVEALLEAGAWINDRGGKLCEGITPLHDAAACGNIEVVKLLLSCGASVIIKDDHGKTPLESLVNYRLRSNLSRGEEQECIDLEEEIKVLMGRTGHKIPEIAKNSSRSRSNDMSYKDNTNSNKGMRRNSGAERSKQSAVESKKERQNIQEESFDDLPELEDLLREDQEEPNNLNYSDVFDDYVDSEEFVNPLLPTIQQENKTTATETYLSAIGSVGSAARRTQLQKSSSEITMKKDKKVALVTELEDVGDNWLDDDLGIYTKKRKRAEKFEFEYKENRKEGRALQERNSEVRTIKHAKKKPRQTKLTSIVQKIPKQDTTSFEVFSEIDDVDDEVQFAGVSSTAPIASSSQVSVNSKGVDSRNTNKVTSDSRNPALIAGSSNALRLRVRVQNRLLLVPVAGGGQGRTVEWLAAEVTRRYYQLAGLRPHLTLTTQDGAVLDPNDPISLVLPTEQGELQAQVTSWDLPPLPERYTQACQSLGVSVLPCLTSALHQTEASSTLDISHMGRLKAQLHPMLRAIQCQQSLHSLILAKCRLGDDGFKHLMDALPSLPSLELLDLRCSSLTTSSLLSLTEEIGSGRLTLKTLASLDMSYNNFSGAKISDIATLLSIPTLSVLSIKHCLLSLTGQHQLPITSSNIKKLELDYNCIYEAPLISLLSCIPKVSQLSLSGLNFKNGVEVKLRNGLALASILGAGEECHLESLNLSCCGLTDSDLEEISAYLYRCPRLTSVDLSHNKQLSNASISALLSEVTSNMLLPLKSLSLQGIKMPSDMHDKLVSVVRHKATSQNALSKLSVTPMDNSNVLESVWKSLSGNSAIVEKIGNELFLSH